MNFRKIQYWEYYVVKIYLRANPFIKQCKVILEYVLMKLNNN